MRKLTYSEASPTLCNRINSICHHPTANALEESFQQITGKKLCPRETSPNALQVYWNPSVVIQQRIHWGNHSIRKLVKKPCPRWNLTHTVQAYSSICSHPTVNALKESSCQKDWGEISPRVKPYPCFRNVSIVVKTHCTSETYIHWQNNTQDPNGRNPAC